MTREILNRPHPTPHPDGPHAAGSSRGPAAVGPEKTVPPADQAFPDDGNFDSCMDDVNLLLTNPQSEPDPVLRSKSSSSELIPRIPADIAPPSSQSDARPRNPRTSEIFTRVGPAIVERAQARSGAVRKPVGPASNEVAADADGDGESQTVFEGNAFALGDPAGTPVESRAVGWASDDDAEPESRIPWPLIILMSYSSAVTLALTWVLIGGRSLQPAADTSSATSAEAEMDPGSKASILVRVDSLPTLPAENVVRLHQTIRLGDLEITPLEISYARLDLVRTFEPFDHRRDKAPVLNMKLRFKNRSKKDAFSPLEPRFIRDQLATVDRSLIVPPQGNGIRLYPLAIDSEWTIEGQEFTSINPGDTQESIVASETGILDRITDKTMWRLRLRVGLLRTDVVGVQFDRRDVLTVSGDR